MTKLALFFPKNVSKIHYSCSETLELVNCLYYNVSVKMKWICVYNLVVLALLDTNMADHVCVK